MADQVVNGVNTPSTFISVDEALERTLALIAPLLPVRTALGDALGLVSAADVVSPGNVPSFDNSAFDGYAVRSSDVVGAAQARPAKLDVVGTVPAGRAGSVAIEPGKAARIMTGAPIPPGADAVVPFEDTDQVDWGQSEGSSPGKGYLGSRTASVLAPVTLGENVRRAGGDVTAGDVVVRAGCVIRAAHIGVLGSVGLTEVLAYPRANVAILPTGDEIVEIDQDLQLGQVRNSNAWALEALAKQHGAMPRRLPIAADTTEALHHALVQATNSHLVVTIGGVSMGDYDLVKNVIASHGHMDFWQVNMRPGKPLAVGTIGTTPLIGLPGNPVSSLVGFELFVRPALMKMMGHREFDAPHVKVLTEEPMVSSRGKRTYIRVDVRWKGGDLVCTPTGDQSSFRLTSLTKGNGLAIVPEGTSIEAGEEVWVHVFEEREILRLLGPKRG